MTTATMKKNVDAMLKNLPEDATWEDLMYSIYVRQSIEKGKEDVREGKIHAHAEVQKNSPSFAKC